MLTSCDHKGVARGVSRHAIRGSCTRLPLSEFRLLGCSTAYAIGLEPTCDHPLLLKPLELLVYTTQAQFCCRCNAPESLRLDVTFLSRCNLWCALPHMLTLE